MDVKTYFDTKKEMTKYCNKGLCDDKCKMHIMNNNQHVNCLTLEMDYPEVAEEIIQQYINDEIGYVICAGTLEKQLVSKCNRFESCTECRNSK